MAETDLSPAAMTEEELLAKLEEQNRCVNFAVLLRIFLVFGTPLFLCVVGVRMAFVMNGKRQASAACLL